MNTPQNRLLIILSTIVLMIVVYMHSVNKPRARAKAPISKCELLRKAYQSSLEDRFTAMSLNYHDKGFDDVVAHDAYNLSKMPNCIDNSIDISKLKMWSQEHLYKRLK